MGLNMNTQKIKARRKKLLIKVIVRLVTGIPILGALFFLTAGTFSYWEAWAYLAALFIPMILVMVYFLKNDPELLERRMKIKEKEKKQKLIIKLSSLYFLASCLLPGLDKRYGWSSPPTLVVILALLFVVTGYAFFILVLKENSYASRVIEVEQQQTVITTGPYALVRHPMYSAIVIMYLFSPLALGSYWAMIPSIFLPVILIARILNEEEILLRDLNGYQEYIEKVKFRLIPRIW